MGNHIKRKTNKPKKQIKTPPGVLINMKKLSSIINKIDKIVMAETANTLEAKFVANEYQKYIQFYEAKLLSEKIEKNVIKEYVEQKNDDSRMVV